MKELKELRGLVATVVTSGFVDDLYASCHEEMRVHNEKAGLSAVEYRRFPAALVEQGRDSALEHALNEGYDYCVQIDADATFPPDSVARILTTAFQNFPDSDAVGAYCQLKGGVNICTIDTGSGTWEPHFPGEGVLPVIRTGAHFILVKTSALRKFGPPWFRTRLAWRAIDALAEVDNFARTKLNGVNPFAKLPEWQALTRIAKEGAGIGPSGVGEDSGLCDALTAAGGRIYVDTDIVTGHVEKRVIQPTHLKEALDKRQSHIRAACGVLG